MIKTTLNMILYRQIKLIHPLLTILVDLSESRVSYRVIFEASVPNLTILTQNFSYFDHWSLI